MALGIGANVFLTIVWFVGICTNTAFFYIASKKSEPPKANSGTDALLFISGTDLAFMSLNALPALATGFSFASLPDGGVGVCTFSASLWSFMTLCSPMLLACLAHTRWKCIKAATEIKTAPVIKFYRYAIGCFLISAIKTAIFVNAGARDRGVLCYIDFRTRLGSLNIVVTFLMKTVCFIYTIVRYTRIRKILNEMKNSEGEQKQIAELLRKLIYLAFFSEIIPVIWGTINSSIDYDETMDGGFNGALALSSFAINQVLNPVFALYYIKRYRSVVVKMWNSKIKSKAATTTNTPTGATEDTSKGSSTTGFDAKNSERP